MKQHWTARILWCFLLPVLSALLLAGRALAPDEGFAIRLYLEADLFAIRPLARGDVASSFERVRPSVVQIVGKDTFGSGNIYEITKTEVKILTCAHVCADKNRGSDAEKETGEICITFFNGYSARATSLFLDRNADLALLSVRTKEIPASILLQLKKAALSKDLPSVGSPLFLVHEAEPPFTDKKNAASGRQTANTNLPRREVFMEVFAGTVYRQKTLVKELGKERIYANCQALPGMSGGGAFDDKGGYIGMLEGGTFQNEAFLIPTSEILRIVHQEGH